MLLQLIVNALLHGVGVDGIVGRVDAVRLEACVFLAFIVTVVPSAYVIAGTLVYPRSVTKRHISPNFLWRYSRPFAT